MSMAPILKSLRPAAFGLALALCGFGFATKTEATTASNPVPSITSLSPTSVVANAPAFTLTVNGINFVHTSTVNWNGAALATTYHTATTLTASVPAADITSVGSASVTVFNPAPGGGTSNPVTFAIDASYPLPSIAALTPPSEMAGGSAFTLRVSGSGFMTASIVNWNGAALATTFVGATTLTASVPAADITSIGSASVTVFNPAPGGGTSNAEIFTISPPNPVPSITSLSPTSVVANGPAFTLTVNGSNFVHTSTVNWNGAALATTYHFATQLTASVPAGDISSAGSASVTVFNPTPGGGTSNAGIFTISGANPLPSIVSLSPASAVSGGAAFTLSVSGSGFIAASTVNWNGAALATTYVSATQLTASVPAGDIASAGSASVTVFNPAPGGGTSNATTFTINSANPLPSVTSLSPASAVSGGAAFTLSVSGSGFLAASTVTWNGAALATTYVSATQLTAAVPAGDIASAGTASVTVFNPAPGGGTSNAKTFTINSANPVPSIVSLTPSSKVAGSSAFTLSVSGSGFIAASTVNWNGAALATTYVSATQLTASVPAGDISSAGSASVTVFNPAPGGGTSNATNFTINAANPLPSIASLTPPSAVAGSSAFTLSVSGSGFIAASTVNWNGAALATTYVSATQLTASVPAGDIASAGTASVTVVSPAPGGGTSNAKAFTISSANPVPSITSLSPTSAVANGPAFTLTVNGSNFVGSSTVNWNGAALATTYVSATQLSASVPAGDISSIGSASVTVVNPTPGGGTSNATTFTINAANPLPSIASLSPASAVSGSAAFTLTVSGSGFIAASIVNWNGTALATTYVSATTLTASVPAGDIASAGSASVTVFNPAPGGGTSNVKMFTINATNPLPSITSLSPTSAVANGPAFTLTVNGSNFVGTSTVNWNGAALTTTYVSATQLTAAVPAGDIASAGSASVTVFNPAPGGGTSGAATFIIKAATAGPYIRQFAQYTAYPGDNSTAWNVTLNGVQAGSTIYVVGTWPNFSNTYPTMAVTDSGSHTYTLLDRYDDKKVLMKGIQGTQSMGHWYAANVGAGSYTINMAPVPQTFEDWVGLVAFEVAGASSTPLDGHTLNFQAGIPPGSNTVNATVTTNNSSGILIAVTFDDIAFTAPTEPLAGSGFTSVARPLWNFAPIPTTGGPAAAAEYLLITSSGAHTATFSPQEGGSQFPDYMTCAAVFQ
jgi:hypothetical protein